MQLPNKFLFKLFLLISFLFVSCSHFERFSVQQSVKRNIGKTIDLSYTDYQLLSDTVVPFAGIQANSAIIVTQVHPNLCVECLSKYVHVAEKYVSNFHSDSLVFVVILGSDKQREVKSMISDIDTKKLIILYAENNDFLKQNQFVENRRIRNSFLLDRNAKIVLVGDPLTNQKLQYCYNKQIQELLVNEAFWGEYK